MDRTSLLVPFLERPADALVVSDFDGTLSAIVTNPDEAAPVEGAIDVLDRLSRHVGEVAIISGRPLEFLEQWIPDRVTIFGLYGLESRRNGERVDHPSAGAWRETINDVVESAFRTGPIGTGVEPKGLSVTLHYRTHPEIEDEVLEWARAIEARTGLLARPARMSVELHPPVDEDKGTVLGRLAADHDGPVLFAGDDVGDLPAFEALATLRASGRHAVGVVIDNPESPDALRSSADLVVDGPAAVVDLLDRIATGHVTH